MPARSPVHHAAGAPTRSRSQSAVSRAAVKTRVLRPSATIAASRSAFAFAERSVAACVASAAATASRSSGTSSGSPSSASSGQSAVCSAASPIHCRSAARPGVTPAARASEACRRSRRYRRSAPASAAGLDAAARSSRPRISAATGGERERASPSMARTASASAPPVCSTTMRRSGSARSGPPEASTTRASAAGSVRRRPAGPAPSARSDAMPACARASSGNASASWAQRSAIRFTTGVAVSRMARRPTSQRAA